MSERKLASIRRISDVRPIPGADNIECAVVGGWTVVIRRGEYIAGDLAVYVEPDAWVPHELAPFLSQGREPSEFNGVRGHRLRTVRLRGQISQGLLLPWTVGGEGDDLTQQLGIQKWQAPIPVQLAGEVRGQFPAWIPRTDQERCQNLVTEIAAWHSQGLTFELSEKMDGTSMTVYVRDADQGVCSRNLDLRETETNTLWRAARRQQLFEKIRATGRNLALQGELVGPGIQGNLYKLTDPHFFLYDVYDIDQGQYWSSAQRREFAASAVIAHVPVIADQKDLGVGDVQDLLTWADDQSRINPRVAREGLVFKCNQDPSVHFKVISNKWLLKHQ
jgi:RNA ligase (TIGR02306 family)